MEAASEIIKTPARGHKYAIQISTELPTHGGRTSPNSDDESLVFGKLARGATTAYVSCDPTIALPILVTALSQTAAKYMKGRKRPTFMGKDLTVEVP
jgi:deoxyhypusine synthase